jgi:hypothetical protein
MKKKENFTLEFIVKEDNGTLMEKRSFMFDKMHMTTRGMKKRQIWHIINIINIIFHDYGIDKQIVAWVLSQNIEVTLNGVNARHNILHKQIAQEPRLVDDTPNLIEEPKPPKQPHHRCPNM